MSDVRRMFQITVLVASFLSGCALMDGSVDLTYAPEAGKKSPLSTLSPMVVILNVEDKRPSQERGSVGNKRNGYGMVTASVRSNRDVPIIVQEALKNELVNNGHKVSDGKEPRTDIGLLLGLKRYWGDLSIHFWDLEFIGTLDADVAIRDSESNLVIFSKPISSAFRESRQLGTDSAFESVLNGALAEFIRSFSRDPGILNALRRKEATREAE